MSAITLVPIEGQKGQYQAKFQFLNVKEGSGLYFLFRDKLFHLWNEMCEHTNAEGGLIDQINSWAEEYDISGDDERYISYTNMKYKELLDDLCERDEYKYDMHCENKLKMHCIMDPYFAGGFDVEIVVE